jgi:hypothetical protein
LTSLGLKSLVPKISDSFLGRLPNDLACETKSTKTLDIVIGQQKKRPRHP